MHIVQIRVLTAFPILRQFLYHIVWIAAIICAWLLLLFTVRMLDGHGITVPLLTIWLRKKQLFPFYEDLILYTLFASSGLYLLEYQRRQRFNRSGTEYQNRTVRILQIDQHTAADTTGSKVSANNFGTENFITGNAFIIEKTTDIKCQYHDFFIKQGLTEREADVAVLIAFAKSNKEIASELCIAYNTVKNHIANVYKKTDTHNRFELARFARAGLTAS